MSDFQDYVPLPLLLAQLQDLCAEHRSGTLLITTDANNSVQFSISKGTIVFVAFRGKTGMDALKSIREIKSGKWRFIEGAISAKPTALPSTEELLKYLYQEDELLTTLPTTPTSSTTPPSAGESKANGLLPAVRAILENAFIEFAGPLGKMICKEHLKGIQGVDAAIQRLAAEIPNAKRAQQFIEIVRKQLK